MHLGPFAFVVVAALGLTLTACRKRDPWTLCRGDPGFRAALPTCADDGCRGCSAVLELTWRQRARPSQEARFRGRFMSAPANAREDFVARLHPDGSYPLEHCTAGLAHHATCAGYSPLCVSVLGLALRDTTLAVGSRRVVTMSADQACPPARRALIDALARCEPIPDEGACESPSCTACEVGRLAALSVLAQHTEEEGPRAELEALVTATPEPVARALVETLGNPEPPADLEPRAVQVGLRLWCFHLVGASPGAPPYGCNEPLTRHLTHPEWSSFAPGWSAVVSARPEVRRAVLSALFTAATRPDARALLGAAVLDQLAGLPAAGTQDAIVQAMATASTSDAQYAALRAVLVRRGVTAPALPPEDRRAMAPPSPTPTPAAPEVRGGSGGVAG
jgi:hypothetical protein